MFQKQANAIQIEKIKDNQGFSIIEVLMALSIFAIGILAVWSMQLAAISNNASAKLRTEATLLASKWVESTLSEDYGKLTGGRHSLSADPDDPAWYSKVYAVERFVALDNPVPATATIEVRVCWQENKTAPVDSEEN